MNKKIVRGIMIFVMIFVMVIPVYAQPNVNHNEVTSVMREFTSEDTSRIQATPKGRYISSASLQISDEGNGMIGVYADTLCHEAVRQIYIGIDLEIWIESEQDWRTVDMYEEEWNAADYPEGSLSMAYVSFDIDGLTEGYTYRLRGYHSASGFGTITEYMATSTSGIELGKYTRTLPETLPDENL